MSLRIRVPGNAADGGLVDQLGVGMVGRQGGDGLDFRMPHENGVALHMAEARGVPNHPGIEICTGLVLGHRPGDHPSAGPSPARITSISDSATCLPWVRSFSLTTASASSFTITTLV